MSNIEDQITKPTFIVDRQRVLKNIEKIKRKTDAAGIRFRPHFKTHQSAEIGEWFRLLGVEAVTVSSVEMAAYFARHNWRDITIAFPLNRLEIEEINRLAGDLHLHLLVESGETVAFLKKSLRHPAGCWIEIDTGYKRTGLEYNHTGKIVSLAGEIKKNPLLRLRGLLTHPGHSYRGKTREYLEEVYRDTVAKMEEAREKLEEGGYPGMEISIGDTPTCSVVEDFYGAQEIRCGNFVFYDVMQLELGACGEEEIAAVAACPVVATYPERGEIAVYGGAVHLSKDHIVDGEGNRIFGYVARFGDTGWGPRLENTYVSSLSQEHGIIRIDRKYLPRVRRGDVLAVLPVHSCLAANLMSRYMTLEGQIIETIRS